MKTQKLFIDQYGNKFYAKSATDLKNTNGIKGKISKMFNDGVDGKTYQTGYVIGQHWFSVYEPMRKLASF